MKYGSKSREDPLYALTKPSKPINKYARTIAAASYYTIIALLGIILIPAYYKYNTSCKLIINNIKMGMLVCQYARVARI